MSKFTYVDNGRLAVIRPDKPEIPLRIAKESVATNDKKRFDNLLYEAESLGVTYTFAGWAKDGDQTVLLDNDGKVIGKMKPGDSVTVLKEDGDPVTRPST